MIRRGWLVKLKDGKVIEEGQMPWRSVPKKDIDSLSLVYDGRVWELRDKPAYFVRTKASMVPGVPESLLVEERVIGYYEGASKVCYIIDELTGAFRMKVEG